MMKQMCKASVDENGFVMNYDESYNLVKETYSGSMQITENFKITNWQAASHLYHGKGVNVNPEDFGIIQAELIKIQVLCFNMKNILMHVRSLLLRQLTKFDFL